MALGFQVSAGSITGRNHLGNGNLLLGKNNQDSFSIKTLDDCIIATVHDGCSSSANSDVGAGLFSRILTRLLCDTAFSGILHEVNSIEDAGFLMEGVRTELLAIMIEIARHLNCNEEDLSETIHNFFLFTTVGFIITRQNTFIFSTGDGFFAINGEVHQLGPFLGNAPPYSAYALLDTQTQFSDQSLKFQINSFIDTEALESLMVATDGLQDILGKPYTVLPGKKKFIGAVSQLWNDCRFFSGEQCELITPWLRLLNSEVVKLVSDGSNTSLQREGGLLRDDTTVVVLRRRGVENEEDSLSSQFEDLEVI